MNRNTVSRKFRKGDKVRVLDISASESTTHLHVGDIVEVSSYKGDGGVWVSEKRPVIVTDSDGVKKGFFEESALELVEESAQVVPFPTVYLAAPISTDGDIMYVNHLASELRSIGYYVHSPIEDDAINDKSRNPQSTDIYGNDTNGIDNADIVLVVESGREQVGTHVELGKVLNAIENGSDVKLVAFTNNKRLQSPQIEDGLPSASMNAFAYGGIKKHGIWVTGGTEGILSYMQWLIEYYVDDGELGGVEPVSEEEKFLFEGDCVLQGPYTYWIQKIVLSDNPYLLTTLGWRDDDSIKYRFAKLLDDGRVYEWSSDTTFINKEAYLRHKEAQNA